MNSWFAIRAQTATEPTEVSIYGDIGAWGVNAASLIDQVKSVQGPIRVRINSGGGDVFEGLALYNYLAGRGNVETIVDGLAASAASLPFLAGNKRTMPKSAYLMIHNPWSGAVGDAGEMRKMADTLDRIGAGLASIYSRVTGIAIDAVQALMDAETWMLGETAKEGGWATDVVDLGPVKASIRPGRYAKAPAVVIAAAPNELLVGDYVRLTYGQGETKGEIIEILRSGAASGADGAVNATEEDPAALIEVLREVGSTGNFEETDVQVARLFSSLTKTDAPTIVEIESPEDKSSDQPQNHMSKTAKLLALLGVQPAAEDTFLASAIADLGVTPGAVTEARKTGTTDFLATHIKDRIDSADAATKAATDRANAILAACGAKADAADIAAEVASAIETKASARAVEMLAQRGIPAGKLAKAAGKPSTDSVDRAEIVAKFNAMKPGAERSAFFAANKQHLL